MPQYLPEPPLLSPEKEAITAQYIMSADDIDRGAADMLAAGLGLGVEQVAVNDELTIVPCSRRCNTTDTPTTLLEIGPLDGRRYFCNISIKDDATDFVEGGFAALMTFLAGDIFGASYCKDGLVLHDLVLPSGLIGESFKGPKHGVAGVNKYVNNDSHGKSIFGLLLKPDLGVDPEYYSAIVEAAVQGGIDYIKEDELCLNSSVCSRLDRIEKIAAIIQKSGRKVLYAANVTSKPSRIFENARQAVDSGANAILVNGVQVGLDIVSMLANDDTINVPIHLHRAGMDILVSGTRAIDLPCLTTLFRLAGADLIHVGPPTSPLFSTQLVLQNCERLNRDIPGVKASMPVFSRSSADTIPILRENEAFQNGMILCDNSIYGSPLGIEKATYKLKRLLDEYVK